MKLMISSFAVLACLNSAFAQTRPPSFDAASIKPAQFIPGQSRLIRGGPGTSDPGRITYTRVSFLQILMKAYGLPWDHIAGPKWIDDNSMLFELIATMPPDTSQEQFRLMLRSLLSERFHLKQHGDTKLFPTYDLFIAKAGTKLKESAQPPNTEEQGVRNGFKMNREGMLVLPGPGSIVIYLNDAERMACSACSMEKFVAMLGGFVNMSRDASAGSAVPVISDKTGLNGKYDFALSFACLGNACGGGRRPSAPSLDTQPVSPSIAPTPDPVNVPTLFVALEKQLGLSLVKGKDIPEDILIVDSADTQPTGN